MIWLQQLSSLVSLKKSGKSTYPSVSALRKWVEKAPLSRMNFQELLLHASRILQVANTRWLRDLLNVKVGKGEDGTEKGEEGEDGGIVEKSENGNDEKNEIGSDGVEGENDEGEGEEESNGENEEEGDNDEEEELNVESKGENENEKGKEEMNDVEMMDQGDDEVVQDVEDGEGGEVEDGEQDEEEYVPSSSSVKRHVKKQKKRVKSEDDQDLNDNSSLKKTMIEEFKTQNSPAI
jgi:hypothetical protein